MARLPAAMLSRSGPLPRARGWSCEVKWDGFRAIVSTVDGLRIGSRRRWNMTELVPELASLPGGLVLDGELVAWGDDGLPSFPRLCERMLHRRSRIAISYVVFDVLEVDGLPTMLQPYGERRAILERWNSTTRRSSATQMTTGMRCFRSCASAAWRASSPRS